MDCSHPFWFNARQSPDLHGVSMDGFVFQMGPGCPTGLHAYKNSLEGLHHFWMSTFCISFCTEPMDLSCSRSPLLHLGPYPGPPLDHLPPLRLPCRALCQDNAGIRLQYSFIETPVERKQEGFQWLRSALPVYTVFISLNLVKWKWG